VFVVGNPRGLEGTFSQGMVSSIRGLDSGTLLQITAPISAGSSGGPVLDVLGNVIGVAVATIREGQNLNFAVPTNYLAALVDRIGVVQPLASNAKSRGTGDHRNLLIAPR
jgi:S1-C subfamily serine protease